MVRRRNRDQRRTRERTYAFDHNPLLPSICVHFITFGATHGSPSVPMPVLMHMDCSTMQTPPRHLLDMYTGASPALAHVFFSIGEHEIMYRNTFLGVVTELEMLLRNPRLRSGRCVAVLINCTAGMHRSVAVAERMARDVQNDLREHGARVEIEHLDTDIDRGIRRAQRARVGTQNRSVDGGRCTRYASGGYVGY